MIFQPQIIGKPLPALTNPGTAADLLSGKQLIDANGNVLTGTMPTQGAQTITPGTTAKTIAAGRYLTGVQTIQGDADLVPGNIKSGVNIFGVEGILEEITNYAHSESFIGNGGSRTTIENVLREPNLLFSFNSSSTNTTDGSLIWLLSGKFDESNWFAKYCTYRTAGGYFAISSTSSRTYYFSNGELRFGSYDPDALFKNGATYEIYYI